MSEEWCREQMAKLQIKDQRLITLNDIRDHLNTLQSNELANATKHLSISKICDCVDPTETTSSEQTNLVCDILSICMSNLELNQSTDNKHCVEQYLQHQNPDVNMVGLNEIKRIVDQPSPTTSSSTIIDPNILMALIKCLESPSTKVAKISVDILSIVLDIQYLDDSGIRKQLDEALKHSDVTRFRVYELSIYLAQKSTELMEKVEFILKQLTIDLDSNDILMQLNALEILSNLAQVSHGLTYLDNSGVFGKITKNIEQLDNNPMRNFLVPGYMRFFGNVSSIQPAKIINGFPNMINALFDYILESDVSILPVAFDTLGHLVYTAEGKILLHNLYSAKLRDTLSEIGKSIHNLSTTLQIRALNCLEIMFTYNGEPNNEISTITKNWFDWLTFSNGLSFIMDFCRNPFPEIKIAALTLLRAICTDTWGQQAVQETAGLIEFLLDRRTEFNKDAVHEKFSVIQLLAQSSVFNDDVKKQLQKYVDEGAFYVQGTMEVAIHGS